MLLADRENRSKSSKSRIFDTDVDPTALGTITDDLQAVLDNEYARLEELVFATKTLFKQDRIVITVFPYIHHPQVPSGIQSDRMNLLEVPRRISNNVVTLGNADARHEEFDSVCHEARTDRARHYEQERLVRPDHPGSVTTAMRTVSYEAPPERRVFHQMGRLQDRTMCIEPGSADSDDEERRGVRIKLALPHSWWFSREYLRYSMLSNTTTRLIVPNTILNHRSNFEYKTE